MKQYSDYLSNSELHKICVENDWFTNGNNDQYQKLFEMNESRVPASVLATVIWTCSDGATLEDITAKLEAATAWPIYLDSIDEALRLADFGDIEREIVREALRTNPGNGTCYRTLEG